jgi:hypothetical protein
MNHANKSDLITDEAVARGAEACRLISDLIARQKQSGNDTRHAEQLETALKEALSDAREFVCVPAV